MAKSVKALITPEVLKWARERRIRLSIEYAAEKLNVKPERLRAWEAGVDQPTFAQLKKIAKISIKPTSLFFTCRSLLLIFDRLQITGNCQSFLGLLPSN